MHALIWPVAESTVGDALADLSTNEQRTLAKLMRRVKQQLLELVENDPALDDRHDNLSKQVREVELTAPR